MLKLQERIFCIFLQCNHMMRNSCGIKDPTEMNSNGAFKFLLRVTPVIQEDGVVMIVELSLSQIRVAV